MKFFPPSCLYECGVLHSLISKEERAKRIKVVPDYFLGILKLVEFFDSVYVNL